MVETGAFDGHKMFFSDFGIYTYKSNLYCTFLIIFV